MRNTPTLCGALMKAEEFAKTCRVIKTLMKLSEQEESKKVSELSMTLVVEEKRIKDYGGNTINQLACVKVLFSGTPGACTHTTGSYRHLTSTHRSVVGCLRREAVLSLSGSTTF